MKIKKNQTQAIVGFLTIILVFILLAFLLPFQHTAIFWIGCIFGMIAILGGALIFALAFGKGEGAKSRFYGFPVARVGLLYAVAQLAVSFLAMSLAGIVGMPAWPFVLVSVLLMAAAVLGVVATDTVRDEIERQDTQLKKDVSKMRTLQYMGRGLISQCNDKALGAELEKLSDELRFSDPVSSEATAETEAELSSLLDELQRAVLDGDATGASGLCKKARAVLSERNRICKLNK